MESVLCCYILVEEVLLLICVDVNVVNVMVR